MNSPKTYWLCRASGSATEGPFTLGQITTMFDAGQLTEDALICEHGSRSWVDLMLLVKPERPNVFRGTQKHRSWSIKLLALCLFVFGLGLILAGLFPFGMALLVFAAMVWTRHTLSYFCEGCGNGIAVRSTLCPTCKSSLIDPPETWQDKTVNYFWWGIYAVILFGVGMLLVQVPTAVSEYYSPEAQKEREELARIETAKKAIQAEVENQSLIAYGKAWENVAANFEKAGAQVVRDGSYYRMRVVLPVRMAHGLSDYDLRMMAQAAYSSLSGNCVVTLEDTFGTQLSKASSWGASTK